MIKYSYVALSADILNEGHINIIKTASKYGKVIVGLLTDKAIASYQKLPYLNFEQRMVVVKNIKYVHKVVPQHSLDHTENLMKYKPNFVVHGDNWKRGFLKKTRSQVVKVLSKWNGELIEPKYTMNLPSNQIREKLKEIGATSDFRRSKLSRLLNSKPLVRVLECHSPLTGLIIENLNLKTKNMIKEFDCMWSSSLSDSVSRGMPDNQSVDYSTRINGIIDIFNVTTKPMIFDIDNGGQIEHLPNIVKKLERAGVSAIIMEDKIGLKKNSLFTDQKDVQQDSIENFCKKIKKAKNATVSEDFYVISRIESLILGKTVNDALKRAYAYSEAGTDCIMIHSKDKNPKTIFEFSKKFMKSKYKRPLIAVPSTYSKTYENQLKKNGIRVVIYANHLLRASYEMMNKTALNILKNERAYEVDKKITPIKDIINLVK